MYLVLVLVEFKPPGDHRNGFPVFWKWGNRAGAENFSETRYVLLSSPSHREDSVTLA